MQDDAQTKSMNWEMLNAYVDSELDPAAAASVATAVARDPVLALRIASLTQLRAVTSSLAAFDAAPPFSLPRRQATAWRPAALAASLVIALGLGAALWSFPRPSASTQIAAAVAAHQDWLAGKLDAASGDRVKIVITSASGTTLPDLSAAGLQLSYVSSNPTAASSGVLAGYRGPHGCRLGLWIARPDDKFGPTPASRDESGLRIRAWNDAGAGYALISRSMDPKRLDRLSSLVARLIAQGHGATDEQRLALAEAGQFGGPCLA